MERARTDQAHGLQSSERLTTVAELGHSNLVFRDEAFGHAKMNRFQKNSVQVEVLKGYDFNRVIS